MKKHLQRITCALVMLVFLQQSVTAQITIGSGTGLQRFPMSYYYGYTRSATIYTAAEMNTVASGATITTLAWYSTITSSTVGPTVIYLKQVGSTTATASDTWANTIAGATSVYSATPSSWVIGWNTIDITDYPIAAGQNLEVLVECTFGGTGSGNTTSTQFQYTASGSNNFSYWQSDNAAPTGIQTASASGAITNLRPNITIGGLTAPACAVPGGASAGTITTTGATISWTTPPTGTFIMEYGLAGYTPGTAAAAGAGGTLAAGSASPITIGGLNPATAYDVNIRQNCTAASLGYSSNTKVTFTTASPPAANDLCSGALVIPSAGPFPYLTASVDNSTATNTGDPIPSCQTSVNKGVWWTFTPASTGSYTISSCQTDAPLSNISDNVVAIYTSASGCAGPFTQVSGGCDDDGCTSLALQAIISNIILNAGTTYYILVQGYNANVGSAQLYVSAPVACANPTGVGTNSVTSTTANVTWTPAGGSFIVEYGPTGFTPGTGATAGSGSSLIATGSSPVALSSLTPNTPYQVYVRQDCTGASNGYSANSAVVSFTTTGPPPVNDLPCNAINLTVDDPTPICTNTTSATYTVGQEPDNSLTCSSPNNIVWYKFTALTNGVHTITASVPAGSTDGEAAWLYTYTATGSCPGTLTFTAAGGLTCASGPTSPAAGTSTSLVTTALTAGTTYYIYVDGQNGDFGDVCLRVAGPATCPAPTAVGTNTITSSTANVTWTPTGGSYIVEYGPTGFTPGTGATAGSGSSFIATGSSPVGLSSLTPGTAYQVYVRQDCTGASGGYSLNSSAASFTTLSLPPANDEAPGAIAITVDAPSPCATNPYNNSAATQSASEPFPTCKGTAGYAGMWYKFTAPASGMVRVSCDYTGSFTDSRMALFSTTDVNNYALFNIIACDDDNGSNNGLRSLFYAAGLTPGATYYVDVDLFSSSTTRGLYCVSVDEISSTMLATTAGNCITDQASVVSYNSTTTTPPYTGWISLVDGSGKLNANVRPTAGTATGFNSSLTIKTGTPRTTGGQPYLNRNYLISGTGNTGADLQLFFTTAEAAAIGGTPATLNVSRVPGAVCNADFTGTATLLTQTANGSTLGGAGFIQVTTPGFSNFYIQNNNIVLPVAIEYFRGSKLAGANYLNWKVSTAEPTVTLVLERSADSRRFSSIQDQVATSLRCLQEFTYTDAASLSGISYYRLKIISPDGSFRYSAIVALLNRDKGFELISVAPNPVKNTTVLSVTSVKGGKLDITVSDVTGRSVMQTAATIIAGNNTVNLDFSALGAGSYQITAVNTDGEKKTTRFVKY